MLLTVAQIVGGLSLAALFVGGCYAMALESEDAGRTEV